MEFAPGNSIFIISRNPNSAKLQELEEKAISIGCEKVIVFDGDLGSRFDDKISEINKYNYELFINVASSTSNLTDKSINPNSQYYYTNVDLTNPLIIIEELLKSKINSVNNEKIVVVFISTILSKINNTNYKIYSLYKKLQEEYIKLFNKKYKDDFDFLLVYVGGRINRILESKRTTNIARSIKSGLLTGKKSLYVGFEGKTLLAAYFIHPVLCKMLIHFSRLIKKY